MSAGRRVKAQRRQEVQVVDSCASAEVCSRRMDANSDATITGDHVAQSGRIYYQEDGRHRQCCQHYATTKDTVFLATRNENVSETLADVKSRFREKGEPPEPDDDVFETEENRNNIAQQVREARKRVKI